MASAVPAYHWSSDTRCEAGRMSKLSLRSGRKKFQPRCMWRIRLWALYWVATPMRRMPEFKRIGQREIDDAGFAAEGHRGLGAPVGQFHQAAAAPAGQHIGHGITGQWRNLRDIQPCSSLPFGRSVFYGSKAKYKVASGGSVTLALRGLAMARFGARGDAAHVAHAAAAIDAGVAVEDFAPNVRRLARAGRSFRAAPA